MVPDLLFVSCIWQSLAWNLAGAAAIMAWTAVLSVVVFGLMKAFSILRVSNEVELKGKWQFHTFFWHKSQLFRLEHCCNGLVAAVMHDYWTRRCSSGLDKAKHGEPAYPVVSWGDAWGEAWAAGGDTSKQSSSSLVPGVQSCFFSLLIFLNAKILNFNSPTQSRRAAFSWTAWPFPQEPISFLKVTGLPIEILVAIMSPTLEIFLLRWMSILQCPLVLQHRNQIRSQLQMIFYHPSMKVPKNRSRIYLNCRPCFSLTKSSTPEPVFVDLVGHCSPVSSIQTNST